MGKLSGDELKKMLDCIKPDPRVMVPPKIGFDTGIHRLGDLIIAIANDPCTGVPEDWFGWLLINYAASDLALSGAKPDFCTITLLGPRPTQASRFQTVMEQTCKAAHELGIAIVRGHTGMYDSLNDLVGVCTVYGAVPKGKIITSAGAKAGDLILCTKPLGIETITNYAISHKPTAQQLFGAEKQSEFATLVPLQSCVREAMALAQINGVHALHDATEGGFVAALNELAEASRIGFIVDWNKIPIPQEVGILQRHFVFDDEQLLALSSTGTILGAVDQEAVGEVALTLRSHGLTAHFIGQFTENKERKLTKNCTKGAFPTTAVDPYNEIMATS